MSLKVCRQKYPFFSLSLFLVLLWVSWCFPKAGELTEEGIVTAVYDGDTIKVMLGGDREVVVRLIGINSPELEDSRDEVRFYALMAKRFVFYHLYKKRVKLLYDWEKTDKYGRSLAYVLLEGRLLNEFILRKGFASVFLKYPFREDYRQRFIQAQEEAKEEEEGLWCREPYLLISSKEAQNYQGSIKRVSFIGDGMEEKKKYLILHAADGYFAALIPREHLNQFPDLQSIKSQRLTVTGFIEDFYGQPQMILLYPRQLQIDR